MENETLEKVAIKLIKYDSIYIVARGTSKASASYLSHLLLINGIHTIPALDMPSLPIIAKKANVNSLFILISLSGETEEIVNAAEIIKAKSGNIVSLTAFNQIELQVYLTQTCM